MDHYSESVRVRIRFGLFDKCTDTLRGDVTIYNCWLQPTCCSLTATYSFFFLYKLAAAGCWIWGLQPLNFDPGVEIRLCHLGASRAPAIRNFGALIRIWGPHYL